MNKTFDPVQLADTQTIADMLAGLPKDALIYIAGYADGRRDSPKVPQIQMDLSAHDPTNQAS